MIHRRYRWAAAGFYLLELIVTVGTFFAAYETREALAFFFPMPVTGIDNYLWLLPVMLAFWSALLWADRAYADFRSRRATDDTITLLKVVFIGSFSLYAMITMVKAGEQINRTFIPIFAIVNFVTLSVVRAVIRSMVHYYVRSGYDRKFLLIVGDGESSARLVRLIEESDDPDVEIRGVVSAGGYRAGDLVGENRVIGEIGDLPAILRREVIDEVYFALDTRKMEEVEDALIACDEVGVDAHVCLGFLKKMNATVTARRIAGERTITFYSAPSGDIRLPIKRAIDLIVAGLFLIIALPVMVVTGLAVKLTSPGPVFFSQERAGKYGRRFVMIKFRTMRAGAEALRGDLEQQNEMEGPVFKIKDDPRVTWIGRILRRTSIDELPQLWNVLKGDMSVVGPRPLPIYEVDKFEQWQRRRMSMKPGLTGLWQVDGRNRISDFNRWMELDLKYIDNWSLTLDFIILLKTVPAVIFTRGAY